jgi:hypothetical protein
VNNWLTHHYILTPDYYRKTAEKQIPVHRIDDYVHMCRKMSLWSYIGTPIILCVSLTFVTCILQFPLLLNFIEITFGQLFRIATIAHIPMYLMSLARVLYLVSCAPALNDMNILYYTPLCLTQLLDLSRYSTPTILLLSHFNLFELAWCALLAAGLKMTNRVKILDVLLLVIGLWIFIAVFHFALATYMTKAVGL